MHRAKLSDINILDVGNTITITGAIWSDGKNDYLCYFPGEEQQELQTLEMTSAEWEIFVRQTDILETEILAKAKDGRLVKTIIRKSTRQIEQGISWRVFKRDQYKCRYCGADDVPLTVDHVVLWESGGPSIEANLVSACKKCNKTRGSTEYPDWLQSEFYKKRSQNLTPEVRATNEALVTKLDKIPRKIHVGSR